MQKKINFSMPWVGGPHAAAIPARRFSDPPKTLKSTRYRYRYKYRYRYMYKYRYKYRYRYRGKWTRSPTHAVARSAVADIFRNNWNFI